MIADPFADEAVDAPDGVMLYPLDALRPWPRNPRRITDEKMAQLRRMLAADYAMLWARPLIARPDGTVIMGNMRLRAARELGWSLIPTTIVHVTDEQARVWALRDNQGAGEWEVPDLALLLAEMQAAGTDLDLAGFGEDELGRLLGDLERDGVALRPERPSLAERFVVPPFSVLDQRAGYWQERRRRWLSIGIRSEEGREDALLGIGATTAVHDVLQNVPPGTTASRKAEGDIYLGLNTSEKRIGGLVEGGTGKGMGDQILGRKAEGSRGMPTGVLMPSVSGRDPSFYDQKRSVEATLGRTLTTDEFIRTYYVPTEGVGGLTTTGTSVFDPVLCEIAYRWFSPPGGRVLDPFAGGSVRGVVASVLGRRYVGVDLSERQVEANREQAAEILGTSDDLITGPHVPTPVERRGEVWVKRDDLFGINGATGGKARATLVMAEGATALVGVGARTSPQIARVARVAQYLRIPARVHTGVGGETAETMAAAIAGADVVRHAPARLAVIRKRARDDKSGTLIPWGAESEQAVELVAWQTQNVPQDVERIVVPVGSGTTLAGILRGLRLRGGVEILGVRVGADPTPVLDRYAPLGWRDRVTLVESPLPFEEKALGDLDGIVLDGTYEAKCLPYLRSGDLLWIVGGPQAPTPNLPEWIVGDLDLTVSELDGETFDLVFTCPPYYDLERYSDDERDLSMMTSDEFDAAYERILLAATDLLADDSFVVIVVSDVRDKQGIYRPLADTTTAIMERLGLGLYNRAVLVNTIGSLAVRVGRQFSVGRKLGRTHQDVLVYVKGDPRRAAERCGQVDVTLEEVLDAETGLPVDDADAADPAAG